MASHGAPPLGAIVEAFGLKTYDHVNGQRGQVVKHQVSADGKTVLPLVQFPEPHGKLMLKPTNIRIVSVGDAPAQPQMTDKQREQQELAAKFPKGTEVEAVGLKQQGNLNGAKGRVESLRPMQDSVRIVVDFGPPSGLVALRPANVKLSDKSSRILERSGSMSPSKGGGDALQRTSSLHRASSSPRNSLSRHGSAHSGSNNKRRASLDSNASRSSKSGQVRREAFQTAQTGTRMVTYQDRYSTFASWPSHLQGAKVNPRELSLSGFYHNPSQKDPDRCTCFTCGYSLVNWGPEDVPWNEHSKHVSTCAFVQAHKASLKASASLKGKNLLNKDLAPMDQDGYLKKQKPGSFTKGWDERYFALRGTTLYYYEEKGQVDLSRGCQCSVIDTDTTSFTVNAVGQTREAFALRASDEYARNAWMEALNGSKQRDMSKEDMEALMGFETAEAETRTQLIFEASNQTILLAGTCIVASMKLSTIIEVEYKERNGRVMIATDQLREVHELRHQYEKRRSNLRLAEHLAGVTRQQHKQWVYGLWRQATSPSSKADPMADVSESERTSRLQAENAEQREFISHLAHHLKMAYTDLHAHTKNLKSVRAELQEARASKSSKDDFPEPGTAVIAYGLKNMASLNGKRGRVKEGQMKDGNNVVLVEFEGEEGGPQAPMFLRTQNVYPVPPEGLADVFRAEPLRSLAQAEARVKELEAQLAGATAATTTATDAPSPAMAELQQQLDASAARMRDLEVESEKLRKQLAEAERGAASLDDVGSATTTLRANPGVVYAPLPSEGSRVLAHDVQSMDSLNGKIGEVVATEQLPDGTGVSRVRFPGVAETLLLRRENTTAIPSDFVLDRMAAHLNAPVTQESSNLKAENATLRQEVDILKANARKEAPATHQVGDTVVAHSLESDTELNGLSGCVVETNNLADGSPSCLVRFDHIPAAGASREGSPGGVSAASGVPGSPSPAGSPPSGGELRRLGNVNLTPLPCAEVKDTITRPLLGEIQALQARVKQLEGLGGGGGAALDIGCVVLVHSLKNKAELNGRKGKIVQKQKTPSGADAYGIEFLETGGKVGLTANNLCAVPHPAAAAFIETPLSAEIESLKEQLSRATALASANTSSETPATTSGGNTTASAAEGSPSASLLPEVGASVVTFNVEGDRSLNHRRGVVVEHRTLPNGAVVAVVDVDVGGTSPQGAMLRQNQLAALPPQEVVDALTLPEQRLRQEAEAALEMEMMNSKALRRDTSSASLNPSQQDTGGNPLAQHQAPPGQGEYFVAEGILHAPHLNGRLGRVVEVKSLNETTTALVADIFDELPPAYPRTPTSPVTSPSERGDAAVDVLSDTPHTTQMLKSHNAHRMRYDLYAAIAEAVSRKPHAELEGVRAELVMLQDQQDLLQERHQQEARSSAEQVAAVKEALAAAKALAEERCREVTSLQEEAERQRSEAAAAEEEGKQAKEEEGEEVGPAFRPTPLVVEKGRPVLLVPPEGGGAPQLATIVSKVDEGTACIRLESDRSSSLGTLVDIATLVALPESAATPELREAANLRAMQGIVQPGIACMVTGLGDATPGGSTAATRGKVVARVSASKVCVRLDGDEASERGAGRIVDISSVLPLPSAAAEALLSAGLAAENERLSVGLAAQQAETATLEQRLCAMQEDEGRAIEASHVRLQKLGTILTPVGGVDAPPAAVSPLQGPAGVVPGGAPGCRFCDDLRREVQELLRQTESERMSQKQRQDRMLGALRDQASSRAQEEARLYSAIERLQRKASTSPARAGSWSPARPQSPHLSLIAAATLGDDDYQRVLPDAELHNEFAALQREEQEETEEFLRCEAGLLRDHATAVAERRDPAHTLAQIDALRRQMLDARQGRLRQQLELLQAIHIRRDAEEELLRGLEASALRQQRQLAEQQEAMLQALSPGDDHSPRRGVALEGLRAKIDEHRQAEDRLVDAVSQLLSGGPGRRSASARSYPIDELDALIQSVGDTRLRSILDGMRREVRRHRSDTSFDALLDGGSSAYLPSSGVSPSRGVAASHFSVDEISEMRRQLAEARANLEGMQADCSRSSDSLAASNSRVAALQGQIDSLQDVLHGKQGELSELRKAIGQVQQLPLLPDNARKILQHHAPLDEAQKIAWLFHHYDTDHNGWWSFEEAYRARGLTWQSWVTLCGSIGVDHKGAGLSLTDVEAMYRLEVSSLAVEYEAARSTQIAGLETCIDNEAWCRREALEFSEAAARRAIERGRNLLQGVDPRSPIRNTLNQVCRETRLQRAEHAEHEERVLSALLYSANNVLSPSRTPAVSPAPFGSPPALGSHTHPHHTDPHARSPSPEVDTMRRALDRLSSQVEAQRGEFDMKLAQLSSRAGSPGPAAAPASVGRRSGTPPGGNELGHLLHIVDRLRSDNAALEAENASLKADLRHACRAVGKGEALSTTERALRCTVAKLLQRLSYKASAHRCYIKLRLFAALSAYRHRQQYHHLAATYPQQGWGLPQLDTLQGTEIVSRQALGSVAEDSLRGLRLLASQILSGGGVGGGRRMSALRGVAVLRGDGDSVSASGRSRGGGPANSIPIDVHEESSRSCIASEEYGSRVELVRWKLSDTVQQVQMSEVGGLLLSLQNVVSGVHIPPEVRARFTKLRIGYGAVGSMQRRLAELEARGVSLRDERNRALAQATAADGRLAEYRSRIHKLRDEARLRNERSKSGSPMSHLSPSPSPRRLDHHTQASPEKVKRWTSEVQHPPPPSGWE